MNICSQEKMKQLKKRKWAHNKISQLYKGTKAAIVECSLIKPLTLSVLGCIILSVINYKADAI